MPVQQQRHRVRSLHWTASSKEVRYVSQLHLPRTGSQRSDTLGRGFLPHSLTQRSTSLHPFSLSSRRLRATSVGANDELNLGPLRPLSAPGVPTFPKRHKESDRHRTPAFAHDSGHHLNSEFLPRSRSVESVEACERFPKCQHSHFRWRCTENKASGCFLDRYSDRHPGPLGSPRARTGALVCRGSLSQLVMRRQA